MEPEFSSGRNDVEIDAGCLVINKVAIRAKCGDI